LLVGLALLACTYGISQAACPRFTQGEIQTVKRVFDGDTFVLTDDTKVRLAGIDTPELGHGRRADDPGAKAATSLLKSILAADGMQVRLELAAESQDRYKRSIAHVYTKSGLSVQEQILGAGLALGYARPPNLKNLECYREAEAKARTQRLGLWQIPAQSAVDIAVGTRGFVRVQGQVQRVNRARKSVWIGLTASLALRVAYEDFRHFENFNFQSLNQHMLEARGYLYTYRGQTIMRIRHPADLRRLP
jgi:endonuclease YncB( thermonuclease family)